MGRRKIEMKMVRDCNSRQVTFSKRRNGLFKKASELATLCAAQVAIVVFSPGGKPFSFGHPSVEAVSQRFLNEDSKQNAHVDEEDGVQNLNEELTELLKQLEIEKKRGKELEKAIADQSTCKYKKPISQLNEDELMDMKTALEALRENLKSHIKDMEASSSLLLLNKATKGSDN
ncbi:hypothetical protein LWI29_035698 [Acer saccharum]|uniref:MADS-box domain-containing protein n=1 Tax=Acer saccharum TaxID=4024 RepID=A0AA39RW93_ACESA|nr:hypothetical protein LWI29_035698 [Acer saccharum]KAK1591317.1 hypothetical protein Q3G72_005744 [Acer saccharum]